MISCIITVYHNEKALDNLLKHVNLIDEITEVILVFDGYPIPEPFKNDMFSAYIGIRSIANYPDIEWGISRAKNIGAANARGDWFMFMDMDHKPIAPWLKSDLQQLAYKKANILKRVTALAEGHSIQNVIVHRDLFFEIGGFDERFDGHYGFEDKFFIDRIGKVKKTNLAVGYTGRAGEVNLNRDPSHNKDLYEKLKRGLHS